MGKISDEIRMFVKRSYADEHMDPKELLALAERIDSELVELPRDRDGVPINVGDVVYLDDGHVAKVTHIDLTSTKTRIVCWISCGGRVGYMPSGISHKPADLIDPTCHFLPSPDGGFGCDRCCTWFPDMETKPSLCPYCGSRVVRNGNE